MIRPLTLRQPAWELHDQAARDEIKRVLFAAAELFPPDLKAEWTGDIQIIGSDAYGCAHDGSDFDVVYVTRPEMGPLRWRDVCKRKATDCNEMAVFLLRNAERLGVHFDWSMGLCAKGLICYSLVTETLHGRQTGERKEVRVRFNKDACAFEYTPYRAHTYINRMANADS